MKSLHQLQTEVAQEQRSAQWNADASRNEAVIKDRIARGYRQEFSLYGGGDPEAMARELRAGGLIARANGSMVMARLP